MFNAHCINATINIDSAEYNIKIAYNLLEHINYYRLQQIIGDLVYYEHN